MRLVRDHQVQDPLVTDAQLAALAIDHGVAVVSTDADFARFAEVRWLLEADGVGTGDAPERG